MSTSTSYCVPSNTGPASLISVIPSPLVSTSVTVGRLKVGRYSLWKQGRLHISMYHGFNDSAVSGSSITSSIRLWIRIMASMLAFSWRRIFSSRDNAALRAFTASEICGPSIARVRRSDCQPGSNVAAHSGSVSQSSRTSIDDGVR